MLALIYLKIIAAARYISHNRYNTIYFIHLICAKMHKMHCFFILKIEQA